VREAIDRNRSRARHRRRIAGARGREGGADEPCCGESSFTKNTRSPIRARG
jgi:hypothetical protein